MLGTMAITLAGCQQLYPRGAEAKVATAPMRLACNATIDCYFDHVGQWQRQDLMRYQVSADTVKTASWRPTWLDLRTRKPVILKPYKQQNLQIPAASYNVAVVFYPRSLDRAENFHLFHQFEAKHDYLLKMYRKRNSNVGSLLNVSVPDPLCVDLYQDATVIRRFCRSFDAVKNSGEFIEQKL